MGRQPFGLASPAAWLRSAGLAVVCADLGQDRLDAAAVHGAALVAFFLPMHAATRLAIPVIDRVRAMVPGTPLAAYGLYAPLNGALLGEHGVTHILSGEFEADLLRIAQAAAAPSGGPAGAISPPPATGPHAIPHLAFRVPDRAGLPALDRYASLQTPAGPITVGYTEASRGCKHRCRHCPIVPVYDGRFRVVQADVVLADIRGQIASGARHITFGDPDFFNGIRHAEAVLTRFARECPGVTYDVTIKIEHLIQHAAHLALLHDTGCAFVTSAVESVDDRVLAHLEKGHTRADFERVVALCREAAVPLAATFVPFTPWTTIESYLELLRTIDRLDLVDNVAPVQFSVRLLIPQGSRMLELPDIRSVTSGFDPASLTYPWVHADPAVDSLHGALTRMIGTAPAAPRREMFGRIWDEAHRHASVAPAPRPRETLRPRATIPYLNEPWYC